MITTVERLQAEKHRFALPAVPFQQLFDMNTFLWSGPDHDESHYDHDRWEAAD